jgi:hypothetical protein
VQQVETSTDLSHYLFDFNIVDTTLPGNDLFVESSDLSYWTLSFGTTPSGTEQDVTTFGGTVHDTGNTITVTLPVSTLPPLPHDFTWNAHSEFNNASMSQLHLRLERDYCNSSFPNSTGGSVAIGPVSTIPTTAPPAPSSPPSPTLTCTEATIRAGAAYQAANYPALSADIGPTTVIASVRCDQEWAAVFTGIPPTGVYFVHNKAGHWIGGLHTAIPWPPTAQDLFTGPSCHGVKPAEIAGLLQVQPPEPC